MHTRVDRNDTHQTHPNLYSHTRVMSSHTGTNTPKFVPSRWGWPPFDLLKRGCANSVGFGARCVLGALNSLNAGTLYVFCVCYLNDSHNPIHAHSCPKVLGLWRHGLATAPECWPCQQSVSEQFICTPARNSHLPILYYSVELYFRENLAIPTPIRNCFTGFTPIPIPIPPRGSVPRR